MHVSELNRGVESRETCPCSALFPVLCSKRGQIDLGVRVGPDEGCTLKCVKKRSGPGHDGSSVDKGGKYLLQTLAGLPQTSNDSD